MLLLQKYYNLQKAWDDSIFFLTVKYFLIKSMYIFLSITLLHT